MKKFIHTNNSIGIICMFFLLGLSNNALSQYVTSVKTGDSPNIFTSVKSASGGLGVMYYQWQDSIKGGSWGNATGNSDNPDYQATNLYDTTYFRRMAYNYCGKVYSQVITVHTLDEGEALHFDDWDQVVVPHDTSLIPNLGNFTIEFWIKTHYIGTPSSYGIVMAKYGSGNYELAFSSSDSISFNLADSLSSQVLESTSSVADGNWHHLAFVRDVDNASMAIYVDGLLDNSASLTVLGNIKPTEDLYLGAYNGSFPSRITLDELRIWKRALNISEIQAQMNCEIYGSENNLSAYYSFNQAIANGLNTQDTILRDFSNNSNHGKLDGFALYGDSSNWVYGKDSIDIYCAVLNGPLSIEVILDSSISCYGRGDAGLSVNAYGGISPYSYQWSTNTTTSSITGLSSGTYMITVSAGTETAIDTFELIDPLPLSLTFNTVNASCRTGNDGTARAYVSGGTSPYYFNWSNGMTNATINNLLPGKYYLEVSDVNNCTVNDSITISSKVPYFPNIISNKAGICLGDSVELSIDTSGVDYCWFQLPRQQLWEVVGSYGFSTADVNHHSLAINPITNEPYVAFGDNDYSDKTTVMKYDGVKWTIVGTSGFTAGRAEYQSLAFHPSTGEPYVAYSDDNYSDKTSVMKFNGSVWEQVGSVGFSAGRAEFQSLAFHPQSNEPYVAYQDDLNSEKTTVMYYDGISWKNVGSVGFSPSNAEYQKLAFNPSTHEPYVAFSDKGNSNKSLLMRFNGSSWQSVGTAFSPGSAIYLSLAFHPSTYEPYVAFQDKTKSDRTSVMKYSGGSWSIVGTAGFSAGASSYQSLAFNPYTKEAYVAYMDGANSNKTTVMSFNGSSWANVGSAAFSPGISQSQNIVFHPATLEPFVSFLDVSNSNRLSVMKFAYQCDGTDSTFQLKEEGTYQMILTYANTCQVSSDSIIVQGDTTAPTVLTKNIDVYLNNNGLASIVVNHINVGTYDNCAVDSLYLSQYNFDCSMLDSNYITLTARDFSNNISTAGAWVIVHDQIAPIVSAKSTVAYLDSLGLVNVAPLQLNDSSSDNCNILIHSLSDSSFDCSNIGPNRILYSVEDSSLNLSATTTMINVYDTLAPFIYTKSTSINIDASGTAKLNFSMMDNGTIDNCQLDTVFISPSSFNCSDVGANPVVITAVDIYSNTSIHVDTVYVVDSISPVARAKDTLIYLTASGSLTIDSSFLDNGSYDNCGTISISLSQNTFDCSHLGSNKIYMSVSDASMNVSLDSSKVTLVDTIAPRAHTKSDTVYIDNLGFALLDSSNIDSASFDNCGILSFDLNMDTIWCRNLGPQTINYTLIDHSGNISTGSEIIFVMDTTAPRAILTDTTVYLELSGNINIDSSFINLASYDNCGISNINLLKNSFTCADVGQNIIQVQIEDFNGNRTDTFVTITVKDSISPVTYAIDTTLYLNSSGSFNIDSSYVDNGSYDNCGTISISLSQTNFDCSHLGSNVVYLNVMDASNNLSIDSAIVKVLDTTAAIALTKRDTVYLNNQGFALVDSSNIDSISSDNCGVLSYSLNVDTLWCRNLGAQTINYTLTDLSGNLSSGSEIILVLDTTAPTAVLRDSLLMLDANGMLDIDSSYVNVASFDNCGIKSINLSKSNFSCMDIGPNIIQVQIEDFSFNRTDTFITINIEDSIAAVAIAKDTLIYLDSNGTFVIDSSFVNLSSSDNCGIYKIGIDRSNFGCSDIGSHSLIMDVQDFSGNVSYDTVTVFVRDSIKPIINVKSPSVYLNQAGFAFIDSSHIDSASSDNCGIMSFQLLTDSFDCSMLGNQMINFIITDSSNNQSMGSTIIKVLDSIAPLALPKDSSIYLDANGTASIDSSFIIGSSMDNCDILSVSLSKTNFGCLDVGLNRILISFKDQSLNTSDTAVNIWVLDTLSPMAVSIDTLIYLDQNAQFTIDSSFVNNNSSDNCAIQSILLSKSTFDCSDTGINIISMIVTDSSNNTDTVYARVEVRDSISPTIVANGIINLYLNSNSVASIDSSDVNISSFDNCGIYKMTLDQNTFNCSNLDTNEILFTVTDVNNNKSSMLIKVVVKDSIPPSIINCPSTIYANTDSASCTASINWSLPTAKDSCGIDSLVSNFSPNDDFPIGSTIVQYIAYDSYGNTDSCSFTVIVSDKEKPQLTNCPQDLFVNTYAGSCYAIVNWTMPTATDNCMLDSLVSNFSPNDTFEIGLHQIMYIAYDSYMNRDTCIFNITVEDNEAPVLNCQSDTLICDPLFHFDSPSYTENCFSTVSFSQIEGLPSGSTYPIGLTQNVFVAIDSSGNSDTCSFTVTVLGLPTPSDAGEDIQTCLDTVHISANIPIIGSGLWKVVSGNALIMDVTNPKTVVSNLSIGNNELEWSISNGICDISRDTLSIFRTGIPSSINAGSDTLLCSENELQLNASANGIYSSEWKVLSGSGKLSDPFINNPIVSDLSIGSNLISWTISNGSCDTLRDSLMIQIAEKPEVNVGEDRHIYEGDTVHLSAKTSMNIVKYTWSPAFDLSDATIPNPIAQPSETINYTLEVLSADSCTSYDELNIFVNQFLEIATGLSPNNDGKNDTWIIKNIHKFPQAEIYVYSRNGQKVFNSIGYENAWEGTFDGRDLPTDSYYYIIKVNDDVNRIFEGTVTIIR